MEPGVSYLQSWGPEVAAAIIGGFFVWLVSAYYRTRKRLAFFIQKAEKLTAPVQDNVVQMGLKIGDTPVAGVSIGTVFVRNIGNSTIPLVEFDIAVKGPQTMCIPTVQSENLRMVADAVVSSLIVEGAARINVKLPFLNSGEFFKVRVVSDGDASEILVFCRLEDVKVKTASRQLSETSFFVFGIEVRSDTLGHMAGAFTTLLLATTLLSSFNLLEKFGSALKKLFGFAP